MYTYAHVILSLIFSGILYPFIGWNSLIVFLSGFVFDIDHYFYYVIKKKDFSFFKAYMFSIPGTTLWENHGDALHIFHTVEFWSLLVILSVFIDNRIIFVFIGLMLHMILDRIYQTKIERFGARAWSLIRWIGRN